jgi:hypothetical protein
MNKNGAAAAASKKDRRNRNIILVVVVVVVVSFDDVRGLCERMGNNMNNKQDDGGFSRNKVKKLLFITVLLSN